MGLFRESLDRDEDMLLDAARSAAKGAAKLSPEVGALREQFERYDVDNEGVVDEADFDGVLRSFGCLGHHRQACLRRFGGRFRDGRVDYLDFCRFASLGDEARLEKCEICDLELMSSRSARALASSVAKPQSTVPWTRPDPKDHGGWRGLDESDDDDDAYPRAVARRSRPASPPRSPRSPRWRD